VVGVLVRRIQHGIEEKRLNINVAALTFGAPLCRIPVFESGIPVFFMMGYRRAAEAAWFSTSNRRHHFVPQKKFL
jgi:hypothetical protein